MSILWCKNSFQTKGISNQSKSSMKAEIILPYDKDLLVAFDGMLESWSRSETKITSDKKNIIINIQAKDAPAFRASLNGVNQLLAVYDKVKNVQSKRN